MLAVERLRDANQTARSEGNICALEFHPSPRVPVLMTASADRRVRLFNVSLSTFYRSKTLFVHSAPSHMLSYNLKLFIYRSTVIQTLTSKPSTSPLSLSQPRPSTQQAPPSSSQALDPSTTLSISNPAPAPALHAGSGPLPSLRPTGTPPKQTPPLNASRSLPQATSSP